MAKIQNGILGGGRGKVSNVIMGKWKGIDYVKAYAIPSNPQTPAQTANRTLFGLLSQYLSVLLTVLIQEYFRDARPRMSGFNAFQQECIDLFAASATKLLPTWLRNPGAKFESVFNGIPNGAGPDSIVFIKADQGLAEGDRVVCIMYKQAGGDVPKIVSSGSAIVGGVQPSHTVILSPVLPADDYSMVSFVIRGNKSSDFAFSEVAI